jgi:hypothetical protein
MVEELHLVVSHGLSIARGNVTEDTSSDVIMVCEV